LNATDELEQTAELLGAPIVEALLGKAAVPDDSPYTAGGIVLLGTLAFGQACGGFGFSVEPLRRAVMSWIKFWR